MVKWEYANRATNDFNDPELAKMGEEGWELVTVLAVAVAANPFATKATITHVFIFKRPIEGIRG